ncbi:MAG TPA: hypothetical protein PK959_13805 [Candidatus Competibacteraceae bacterium]|nr:hypothetical protein [Candidatus Competibacteraceae bacterium]
MTRGIHYPWLNERELIRMCRLELSERCPPLMVGRLTMNSVDELWQRVEADTWRPDARIAQHEVL